MGFISSLDYHLILDEFIQYFSCLATVSIGTSFISIVMALGTNLKFLVLIKLQGHFIFSKYAT
jgi:hypothetical protein